MQDAADQRLPPRRSRGATARRARRSASALLQLEAQGLVRGEPNRGAVVRAFDRADLLDLYEVRALLEPAAAAMAARRIGEADIARRQANCDAATRAGDDADAQIALNEEFHRIIGAAAGSPRLAVAMRAVAGIPRESLLCHQRRVAGFRARDDKLAEAVMRMHILGAVAFLEEVTTTHG